jgi:hypothetical protein
LHLLSPAARPADPPADDEGTADEVCGLVRAEPSMHGRESVARSPVARPASTGTDVGMTPVENLRFARPRHAIPWIEDLTYSLCRLTD